MAARPLRPSKKCPAPGTNQARGINKIGDLRGALAGAVTALAGIFSFYLAVSAGLKRNPLRAGTGGAFLGRLAYQIGNQLANAGHLVLASE